MRRFAEHGHKMYDHLYAQNSDPSAVAGRVAHLLDLRGAASVVSGACASAALALDQGKSRNLVFLGLLCADLRVLWSAVRTLKSRDAELAIVGAITTHFTPGPFIWATEIGAKSQSGRCWAFSENADGYSPSVR